jgi:hypothetical protein
MTRMVPRPPPAPHPKLLPTGNTPKRRRIKRIMISVAISNTDVVKYYK